MSGIALSSLLEGCTTTHYFTGEISDAALIVPLSEFQFIKNGQVQFKKYLVVQNNTLQYPVCVYRLSEENYSALWMRCTHQGTELQVFGDKLLCPSHGSEFSNTGKVETAPAAEDLKSFKVHIDKNQLKISLT